MKCEHAQEFLSEYVTGEMDRALAVTLENHLRACASCTNTVEDLRRLWSTLDEMPTIEPPASFHANLMERIAAEQVQEERTVKPPLRVPAWKSLMQPRFYAYAAVAIILILGTEFVQVQRAALGPLGLVLNVLHPAPPLQSEKVAWTSNGQGGGTLSVSLQAHAQVNGAITRRHAVVHLHHGSGASSPISKHGEISSDQSVVIELPLNFTPRAGTDTLDVSVTPPDSTGEDAQTVSLPLAPGL
jgi:anti-sigma factor RsiW